MVNLKIAEQNMKKQNEWMRNLRTEKKTKEMWDNFTSEEHYHNINWKMDLNKKREKRLEYFNIFLGRRILILTFMKFIYFFSLSKCINLWIKFIREKFNSWFFFSFYFIIFFIFKYKLMGNFMKYAYLMTTKYVYTSYPGTR